jgi:chromosome segregation ATPase
MIRFLGSIGLVLLVGSPAWAQDRNSEQLLQEVRRLREAIESMVSTSARVQIVFGRLQLQEQRTATAVARADSARATLARLSREQAAMEGHQQALEERLGRASGDDRRQVEAELADVKRVLASLELQRQQAVTDQAQATSELNAEQIRWSGLNEQLEQLERLLAKKP